MLNQYTINPKFLEEESEELTSLNKFLKAAKCTIEDLRTACLDNSLDGWGMDAQDRIRNGIKENITT